MRSRVLIPVWVVAIGLLSACASDPCRGRLVPVNAPIDLQSEVPVPGSNGAASTVRSKEAP
jgi:hypothetical protein